MTEREQRIIDRMSKFEGRLDALATLKNELYNSILGQTPKVLLPDLKQVTVTPIIPNVEMNSPDNDELMYEIQVTLTHFI